MPIIADNAAESNTIDATWTSSEWRDEYDQTVSWRAEALPLLTEVIREFREGRVGLTEFHARLTTFAFKYAEWGFKGFGLMFLNQLVNLAALDGRTAELEQALRAALASPEDDDACAVAMNAFLAEVEAFQGIAERHGKAKPARGHTPYVLSFFWEAQDRDRWPVYYPASRKTLQRFGRFTPTDDDLAKSYVDFRRALRSVGEEIGANTWQVEVLLWVMAKPEPPPPPPPPPRPGADGVPSPGDVYSAYAARNLVFNDELITSFVLSLRTKRFAILSGISGTGKTQLALGLARYFEATNEARVAAAEVPPSDDQHLYFQMTEPSIRRGRLRLRVDQQDAFVIPDRGTAATIELALPDGARASVRVNNIGFTAVSRELILMFFRRGAREWLQSTVVPGDVLHLDFGQTPVAASVIKTDGGVDTSSRRRHELIAVKADWTDPRGLIGFFNPITQEYERTPLIDLMLAAATDPAHPHFAILDEMNLARVEYYFSDFLSAMESDAPIWLTPESEDEDADLPHALSLPPNLFFIGTVNIDETTHAFSPKVLDRANVLEFNEVDVDALVSETQSSGAGSGFRLKQAVLTPDDFARQPSDADLQRLKALARDEPSAFTGRLKEVHAMLERHHLHFGYRVVNEVMVFVGRAIDSIDGDSSATATTAFDLAMLQKILPKLGGGRELEEPLGRLLAYCLTGDSEKDAPASEEILQRFDEFDQRRRLGEDVSGVPLPRSATKLARMLRRLRNTGFTSYLE